MLHLQQAAKLNTNEHGSGSSATGNPAEDEDVVILGVSRVEDEEESAHSANFSSGPSASGRSSAPTMGRIPRDGGHEQHGAGGSEAWASRSRKRSADPVLSGPGVYVLELQRGKYYVGKSKNRSERINDHNNMSSRSSSWCSLHGPPVRVLAPITGYNQDFDAWEQKETIVRMTCHGFENVRGWEFTRSTPLLKVSLSGQSSWLEAWSVCWSRCSR